MALETWERQPKETTQAFNAFVLYRDMGEERSYAKVAKSLGKSSQLMDRWGARWKWQVRVEAWERELDREKTKQRIKDQRAMLDRHASISVAFQQQVIQSLTELAKSGKVLDLSPTEMAKWLEVSAKIERLSRGLPSEVVSGDINSKVEGTVKSESDLADRILNNPTARKAALDLFGALAGPEDDGEAESSGTGALPLAGPVETGEAPGHPQ